MSVATRQGQQAPTDPAAAAPVRGDPTRSGSFVVSRNPATGEVLGELPLATARDVAAAMERARQAAPRWAALSVADRVARLRRVMEVIVDYRDEIADLISQETGKPRVEALGHEVFAALDSMDFYARHAGRLLAPKRVPHRLLKTTRSSYHYEPWGVVAVITPWNFPFFLTSGVSMAALFAGNVVINKPSEYTPLVGQLLADIVTEGGIPEGVYQVVQGAGPTGAALLESKPDKVTFTGSVATGRRVAMACAERLIPHTLELGGKDPAIVLEDADLDRAARGIVWGAFCNAGQVCSSIERVYVHEKVADRFTEMVVDQVRKLRQGVDRDFDVDVGPLTNKAQLDKVVEQVAEAVRGGARVLAGGRERPRREGDVGAGFFFEPTVIVDVSDSMSLVREETFGPVLPIMRIRSPGEAIERANDSDYGLTATVWTRSARRARELARALRFGAVYINDHMTPSGAAEVSWGGLKYSGIGKTRGPEGLYDMCHIKHVSVERLPVERAPVWFPYSEATYRTFSNLIETTFGRGLIRRARAATRLVKGLISFGGGRPKQ